MERYYLTHNYYHARDGEMLEGCMSVNTTRSKAEILADLRDKVRQHLVSQTPFVLEGALGQHSPYYFVDADLQYREPLLETEHEYMMRRGMRVETGLDRPGV